jgi:hypothetical protein
VRLCRRERDSGLNSDRFNVADRTRNEACIWNYGGLDIGTEARERLAAALLIGSPVIGLHAVDDSKGHEIVEITLLEAASEVEVARVSEVLGTLPHRIARNRIGHGITYRSPR